VHRGNPEDLRLHAASAEQVRFVAGGEPCLDRGRETHGAVGRERILRAQDDVAHAGGDAGRSIRVLVGIVAGERVHRRVERRREPFDLGKHAGIELDADERHRHADVEPIRHAVGGKGDRRVAHQFEGERGLDEIAFERRRQARVVWSGLLGGAPAAAVGVLDVEGDAVLPEVEPLERVVGRMLVAEADTRLAPPGREGPLGKRWTEAVAASGQRAERRVERIGEAARRRPQRIGREQGHERPVHLRRHLHLIVPWLEVRDVIRLVRQVRREERDGVAQQLRQDGCEGRALGERRRRNHQGGEGEHGRACAAGTSGYGEGGRHPE
jgi:hypothetical protein